MNQVMSPQSEDQESQPELQPVTELTLNLEDPQTKNSTQVKIQLFSPEDQATLVKKATEAMLQALINLGMVDRDMLELKTEIHTRVYRKAIT